ncbi:MAG: UDP-N-acetylmuramoyl-L-alanine--D-glutamate ligase [Bacteroidota bacterium]
MNITVIGAGKSGLEAAKLAVKKGENVFLTESKIPANFDLLKKELEDYNINFELGGHTEKALHNCDLIITSPGVPPHSDIIRRAESLEIPIISEIEYAYQYLKNPIIAITGTNGKTTTTSLTAYILNNSGKKAVAAGNIGKPLASLVDNIENDTIIVAELSSFQLDRCYKFKPDVAVILNITPDHLYYHGSMEEYIQAKYKISLQQSPENLLILNADDSATMGILPSTKAKVAFISFKPVVRGAYCTDGLIKLVEQHNEEELILASKLGLPGVHNTYNSMAAALAARAFEIPNENIRDSLMTFRGVEHRLEFVRTIDGVDFINDSKATNINAAWFALASYTRPIVWIAGGRGDNNDYSQLNEIVQKNVSNIICIGEEKQAIFNHFCAMKRCIQVDTLLDAVLEAKKVARAGEVVLFAPACKSFDMFINFEHRGEEFKRIVNSL